MDIHEYVLQKKKRLERGSGKIKDFRVFDFNYMPEKPVMREEVKPIADAILRYDRTGIPNNLLVVGSRGCGKTLMVKYLMKLIGQKCNIKFYYVNCRQHNTSFKMLAHILGVRSRGYALDELWGLFRVENKEKTVLVLDEIDLISEKDKNKDILYLLSRSPENYMTILLSNNPKILNIIDESIKSTLQAELIHFRDYSAYQLIDILEERARTGARRTPKILIRKIAALTAKNTNSDVRVAIKTLYYSLLEDKVSVEENFSRARKDILMDVITNLNDKNLQILRAVAVAPDKYVKKVYETYRKISAENREEPYSYVYFYSTLAYLQSLNLLVLISTKVHKTHTNRIQLLFDSAVLDDVWRMRFG